MAPTALDYVYCTSSDLEALLSVDGITGRVDDDNSGTRSATESGYITSAINWATGKINHYCLARYAAADLATSFVVNEWCIVLACRWLSLRRGNPTPESVQGLYDEVMQELREIRSSEAHLADLATRDAAWPAWSNCRVSLRYSLRKIRVERPISEKSPVPAPFRQHRDVVAEQLIEPDF